MQAALKMPSFQIKSSWMMLGFAMILLAFAGMSFATGTAGTEFSTLFTKISTDWFGGYLGRIIGLSVLLIGLVMGVPKGNAMAIVIAIVFAAAIAYGPTILDGITGFGLPILA